RLLFVRNGDIYTIRSESQPEPVALTVTPQPELVPRISPSGRYVSFVRDNTLRLIDIRESREIQLSETMDANWTALSRYCRDNRYTPFLWTPDETALIIPAYQGHFAGELCYFDLANQETRLITVAADKRLLIRDIIWISSKNQLALDYLSETLQTRNIVIIDPQTQRIDTVYSRSADLWYNNFGGKLYWLETEQKLLFGDIQNGYQHIFTIGLDYKTPISITRGKWNVFDYTVNPGNEQLYFSANKDNHYEKHIYTIDKKSDKVLNLSYLHGSHDFVLSATGNYIVDIFSTPSSPPQLFLTRTFPVSKARSFLIPDARIPNAAHLNTVLDKKIIDSADGAEIYYKLWYPAGQLSSDKFPLIVFLNQSAGPVGGLHEWKLSNLISQWLSSNGYVVADIDFPGLEQLPTISALEAIAPWQQQLRCINTVIDELAENEFIDMTRIGITGFGYNGYLSIMALLAEPERFSSCVGIPLENRWEPVCGLPGQIIYEQIGRRQLSPDLTTPEIISQLRGKLLIIHSENQTLLPLIDSQKLIRRIVEYPKRIDFIHYPWEETIIESDQTYVDLLYKLLEYFDRFL
ncbi:MAG: DPP IV N-terminal domain-containing protein, partial [Candidatus Marinimicrobia bacterium]|nr:DPP IV N-terminal domain-containing protein [Candidatus Neomarinimicrobiota bacterium]